MLADADWLSTVTVKFKGPPTPGNKLQESWKSLISASTHPIPPAVTVTLWVSFPKFVPRK